MNVGQEKFYPKELNSLNTCLWIISEFFLWQNLFDLFGIRFFSVCVICLADKTKIEL